MNRIGSTCRVLALCAAACIALLMEPAHAQHAGHVPHQDFHGRDFHHFAPQERAHWRSGRWVQDWHDGRYAWWWIVGGYWYFYPEPMYPFPTYIPPAIVIQQPPPTPAQLPPERAWYYCNDPRGYYPYVASCNGVWTAVPSAPGPAPQ
ncbi:hypothetical protein K6W76_08595 [Burkholderia anthina]|uniref:hypothetical protein n=1 Tax=Burkholderia anthina TaxID=179879 RepID=UPI00158947B3|nr:hypothetical protein [Burkholderia anthina]MBY4866572.1 hypothetical protein [Burkholderia anthina]